MRQTLLEVANNEYGRQLHNLPSKLTMIYLNSRSRTTQHLNYYQDVR
jgi:hypothetical protein